MFSRLSDRLKTLEARIAPQSRVFVLDIDSQSPLSRAEQLAEFKSENSVTSHDHLVVMTFA
jgi:hypothetical protein